MIGETQIAANSAKKIINESEARTIASIRLIMQNHERKIVFELYPSIAMVSDH